MNNPRKPQDNRSSDPNKKSGDKEFTNRQVYVEPRVQIDFVKDFREEYKTAQTESASQSDKQLFWTKISAGLLLIYVGLTVWQSISSQRSLMAIKNQFQVDQRAWLKIGYSWPNPVTTVPATTKVVFQNTGKSVVTSIYADFSFEIVKSDSPPSFSLEKRHNTTSGAPLFPSDADDSHADLFDQKTKVPRAFSSEEVQSLLAGKSYVAVYGAALYTDQFGLHWYRFCSWNAYSTISGTAAAGECVGWNRVGDGHPVPYEK